ncbi:MAG: daunorubicin/doxorubicin resistance ABC transporter ATP-binding protein DrrA, partial [Actinobacteria bacterium]|nr:daunorubicin/doxorubicin resistance ABC transporter ATP-binding protein DrrA [Actinomycetota bacterium]
LEEADQLAGRIAVIDHGRLAAEGTPGELKAATGAGTLRVRLADPAHRPQAMRVLTPLLGTPVQAASDPLLLTAALAPGQTASEQAAAALAQLARAGITVGEFTLGQPTLDEVFLALTTASDSNLEKIS